VAKPVSDSSSGAPERLTQLTYAAQSKGYRELVSHRNTNDPDSIETVAQIGWFQVLKGYVQKSGLWQERFFRRRRQSTKYSTGEQWTKELIEFSGHTATHFGKSGAQSYTHLEDSPDHSSARSDKQPSNAWKWHMHTLRTC
jgi:hypothetical protein